MSATHSPLGRHLPGRHPLRQTPPGRHPPRQTPPRETPPRQTPPPGQMPPRQTSPPGRHPPSQVTATAADGTHPTGMHPCLIVLLSSDYLDTLHNADHKILLVHIVELPSSFQESREYFYKNVILRLLLLLLRSLIHQFGMPHQIWGSILTNQLICLSVISFLCQHANLKCRNVNVNVKFFLGH